MIELTCGKWKAIIVPECGANIISLRCENEEILRRPENEQVLAAHPCVYGVPVLLPANRTKAGVFTYMGKRYTLPINEPDKNNHLHGRINNVPFAVTQQETDRVVTQIVNDGAYYPFPFCLTFEDKLTKNGLFRTIKLENTGVLPMPYTMAFHTSFVEPASFSVPLGLAYAVDQQYIPTGELLPLCNWEQSCTEGMSVDGRALSGFFTSIGNTAQIGNYRMTVSKQFDHWVLWNGKGNGGFLCVEPQCGAVDGLNNGKHLVLQPGKTEVFTFTITQ